MAQTFYSDDKPDLETATPQERQDLLELLECIRTLRCSSGWGVISLTFKGGTLNEIVTAISRKPNASSDK